ncbi:hypothetical protein SLA2020_068670 [Shorea laevis]
MKKKKIRQPSAELPRLATQWWSPEPRRKPRRQTFSVPPGGISSYQFLTFCQPRTWASVPCGQVPMQLRESWWFGVQRRLLWSQTPQL